jgi:hydroxyacylglutathione hydrolase
MTFANSPSTNPPSGEPPRWRFRAADHPHIVPVRAFNDNYIWLIGLDNQSGERQALVVDPGDAAPVLQALAAAGLPLAGILVTHHHGDHTGGIAALKAAWPDAVVYGPRKCANTFIERRFGHGDTLTIPALGLAARVIEVPGHTLDHNAYFCERVGNDPRPVLFCGDTLFAAGCGRLFEGTPPVMFESLARLSALPPQTLVYCAHEYTVANLRFARAAEPDSAAVAARLQEAEALRERGIETVPSTIGVELETNPFLRPGEASVRRALNRRQPPDADDPVAVFAALRQWKNEFQG